MTNDQNCICIDDAQIAQAVARLKEDFASEFGRDVPAGVISESVKTWLDRHLEQKLPGTPRDALWHAATLLREPVGLWEVLGTALVLAGVTLTTLAPSRPAA